MGFVQLFSSDLGNIIFVGVIIIVAVISLIVEIFAVIFYVKRDDFVTTKNAIDFLEKKKSDSWIEQQKLEKKSIFRWLVKHLDGELRDGKFSPKKQDKYFLLFSYPTILVKSVPRSPVYFAPTLLTALGILGTFTGIFAGLQGIDLTSISDNQNLLNASIKLLSGMKLAFVTSLFGLSLASLFMIILSVSGNIKQRFRNTAFSISIWDKIGTVSKAG
jgi:hypothetical protein